MDDRAREILMVDDDEGLRELMKEFLGIQPFSRPYAEPETFFTRLIETHRRHVRQHNTATVC